MTTDQIDKFCKQQRPQVSESVRQRISELCVKRALPRQVCEDDLYDLVRMAVEAEREANARVVEAEAVDYCSTQDPSDYSYNTALQHAAAAIRNRKEQP